MRLLSFLSEIERAITAETPPTEGGGWEASRMVNFQQGLARLTLRSRDPESLCPSGAIFLQAFALADGSVCLKASLTWKGSDAFPSIFVYATPSLNWKLEASRVACAWIEGPVNTGAAATTELVNTFPSLAANAM